MKRLFIVASLAIAAIGCQKTEVQNLVTNEIGFNSEIGKLTRAVNTGTTFENEDFAVYSYGYQGSGAHEPVMTNVQVVSNNDWTATGYYWPNSANTYLNFYAYSPAMNNGVSHTEDNGFVVTFTQNPSNPVVDFMVATPVEGATFNYQGGGNTLLKTGVPMVFNHKLTQVIFAVKSTTDGVTATLNNVTLKNVSSSATYNQKKGSEVDVWDAHATADEDDEIDLTATVKASEESNLIVATAPVVLIPQSLNNIKAVVNYTITGQNIANETVSKEVDLFVAESLEKWAPNQKVVYTFNIGLTAISFTPTVTSWAEDTEVEIPVNM